VAWGNDGQQGDEGRIIMGMYLIKFSHTPETWARLLANPEDRRAAASPPIEAAGGKLHGYWYAFGDTDGYVLFEAPDDVIAAGLLVKIASSGAFTKVSTTKLLTVEEALDALRRGGGVEYRAPGVPGS
jgi:uncharacterized protein with GYD domain